MQILIGTTNPAKVRRFTALLEGYDVQFLTLRDLCITDEPQEDGQTPEENARIKAAFYGRYCDAVICNDSGLYFDALALDDPRQPGLHVRTPQGRRLDDEEMIAYYASLMRRLGGRSLAYYLDAISVCRKGRIFSLSEEDEDNRCEAFYMTDCPSPLRHEGWPLDSLSVDRYTGAYFVDPTPTQPLPESELERLARRNKRVIQFLVEALGL